MKGLKVKKGDELFIKVTAVDVGRWIWPYGYGMLCLVVESVDIYDVVFVFVCLFYFDLFDVTMFGQYV